MKKADVDAVVSQLAYHAQGMVPGATRKAIEGAVVCIRMLQVEVEAVESIKGRLDEVMEVVKQLQAKVNNDYTH